MSEPYIIAEIGSNWRIAGKGDITNLAAIDMTIRQAKACGADAVKFQMFTHEDLYGFPGDDKFSLPRRYIPVIAEKCKKLGIDFMCTAFTADGVKFIDQYVLSLIHI